MSGENGNPRGTLFGLALGDALGAELEFLSYEEIVQRWPPDGPEAPRGDPLRVTDDTQMSLAVAEALMECAQADKGWTADALLDPLSRAFITWYDSPDNDRAPGNACLQACEALREGQPWWQAGVAGSKGCGANMRVAPVGLLCGVSDSTRAGIAQFQAALTHAHPTALASADLTAYAITALVSGQAADTLMPLLHGYAVSQRTVYHAEWLGPIWQRSFADAPEAFIARGWDECLAALRHVDIGLKLQARDQDLCRLTGAGWVAEEALAAALLSFLMFSHDAVATIRRAAATSGDSDTIACTAGALAGAHLGITAWPHDWLQRLEYRDRLASAADFFDCLS